MTGDIFIVTEHVCVDHVKGMFVEFEEAVIFYPKSFTLYWRGA